MFLLYEFIGEQEKKMFCDQQIILYEDGIARFKENKIISFIFIYGQWNLKRIASLEFSDEDRSQFAQLIGYRVSDYGKLSYVSDELIERADVRVEQLVNKMEKKMSYNITNWKVKILETLIIPVNSLFKHEREDWHPTKETNKDGTVTFTIMEGSYLTGKVSSKMFKISEIECWGEGSGTAMEWIIGPALEDSKGKLEAVCIWEGGDTIDQLIVENGKVIWEKVEL